MGAWGQGSLRERRPGVFEIGIAVGVDPVSGRTVQRSFPFHGPRSEAEARRRELAAEFARYRALRRAAPFLTVGELLERWLAAHHDWKPATWTSARSNAKALSADPIAGRRVSTLRPETVRAAMARWREGGAGVSVVSGRFRVLRSALGWAHAESIIERSPLRDMRGPERPGTRLHVPVPALAELIATAERLVEKAGAGHDGSVSTMRALHKAEQVRLLVRLSADSGARRGELAALQFADLDGRVLTIERGVSGEVVGPAKTKRVRRLALGQTTVALWRVSEATWRSRTDGEAAFGPWLFSGHLDPREAPHGQRHGPLVRRALRRGGASRGQPAPPAPHRGHVLGRAGGPAAGPAAPRASRRLDDATQLRPRPPPRGRFGGRRHRRDAGERETGLTCWAGGEDARHLLPRSSRQRASQRLHRRATCTGSGFA